MVGSRGSCDAVISWDGLRVVVGGANSSFVVGRGGRVVLIVDEEDAVEEVAELPVVEGVVVETSSSALGDGEGPLVRMVLLGF